MAKVLVEIDVSKGLLVELDIVCNDLVITQRLDYLNVPSDAVFVMKLVISGTPALLLYMASLWARGLRLTTNPLTLLLLYLPQLMLLFLLLLLVYMAPLHPPFMMI